MEDKAATLKAEAMALKVDNTAYVVTERAQLQARVDAGRSAAGEIKQRMHDAIAALETTMETIGG